VGPTCSVVVESITGETLDRIDEALELLADRIERTRKGRRWNVWINDRPFAVRVSGANSAIELAAGCNTAEDWELTRRFALSLGSEMNGTATEPEK